MAKSDETKFPADGWHVGAVHAVGARDPKRPAASKSKNERPASKGPDPNCEWRCAERI
jgi:hypothetical protein